MKTAIVTGANGFVGCRFVDKLADFGVAVTALDLPGTFSKPHSRENISFIEVDLRGSSPFLERITPGADVLFHLAWDGVQADLRDDYHLQLQNLGASLNVLEFACQKKVKKVIMQGTISEYIGSGEPVTGQNWPSPIEAYGAAKHAAFVLCKTFAEQMGLHFIWVTATSLYGPGRDDNNILSYAIKTYLKGEKPSFTHLEQMWDYLYIDDFLTALYLIGLYGQAGKNYPVASGEARSLKEYITAIRDIIDPTLPLGVGEKPYKSSKAEHAVFVIEELVKDTGFRPEYSFENGITKMIEYFKTVINEKLDGGLEYEEN